MRYQLLGVLRAMLDVTSGLSMCWGRSVIKKRRGFGVFATN